MSVWLYRDGELRGRDDHGDDETYKYVVTLVIKQEKVIHF